MLGKWGGVGKSWRHLGGMAKMTEGVWKPRILDDVICKRSLSYWRFDSTMYGGSTLKKAIPPPPPKILKLALAFFSLNVKNWNCFII